MAIVYQEAQPAWVATTDPALPWRVQTSQYVAEMADYLDAGTVPGGMLWRFTHRGTGKQTAYSPEAVAFVDHLLHFDPLMALAHVQATVAGDVITFDHPAYRVTYHALVDRLKLTILLKVPLRAPNGALVTTETAFLTLTGGIELPVDLETWDRTGKRTGDFATRGEVYLKDTTGNVVQFLDRVTARDSEGHPGAGEIRLVTDANGTRRLYQGMAWGWLQAASFEPTAEYPEGGVEIDPTVATNVTGGTMTAMQRGEAAYSNGTLLGCYRDGSNITFKYWKPGDTQWTALASGASIAVSTTNCTATLEITEDDYACVVIHDGSVAGAITQYWGTPTADRTGMTWLGATVATGNSGTSLEVGEPTLIAHQEGTEWRSHIFYSYHVVPGNTDTRTMYVRLKRVANGTVTTEASVALMSTASSPVHPAPSAGIDASKNLYVTWQTGSTGANLGVRFVKITYAAGPAWTVGAVESIITTANFSGTSNGPCLPDSTGQVYAGFNANPGGLMMFRRAVAGGWTNISPTPAVANTTPLFTIDGNDVPHMFYTPSNANLTYQKWTGAAWSATTIVDAAASLNASVRRKVTGSAVDALYTSGSAAPYTIKHYRLQLNTPPTEPTLVVPLAFHTPSGLTFTVQRNDADPGDLATGIYVKVGSQWWDGTNLVASEPASPIAVAPAAASASITIPGSKFTAGQTYQISAATVDQSGAKGPYNSTPTVTKASTNPVYAQTTPAAASTVSTIRTRVQGAQTTAGGATPKQYIVRQYAANGITILNGPTTIDSTGALNYEIPYDQTTGTTYQTGVIPIDSDGLQGPEVKTSLTVSFTSTITPIATITPNPDQFPPYALITADNRQVDVTTEGNALTLSAGVTITGTDAILDAQNEQASVQHTNLGTGKHRFTATVKDTAAVANDVILEVYNVTGAVVVISTTKTATATLTAYTLDFDAVQGRTYSLRVRKGSATANTITVDKVRVAPVTTATGNRVERRKAGSANAWSILGTCGVNGSLKDYSGAAKASYEYRLAAIGDNQTEAYSAPVVGGIDRGCWWFVPISDPTHAIPFAFNREATGTPQRDRTEVKTRGPVPIKFDGGTDIDTIQIQATWVEPEFASPHDAVSLGREEWRQRFLALDFDTEGYLLEPGGGVWRGFIEVTNYNWVRNMVTNELVISATFSESGDA